MKILFALSRFPFPTLKGDKLRAYYQLKELSKKHEVHLVCLSEDKSDLFYLQDVEPFCASLQLVHLSFIRKSWNLINALFTDKPFQVHYFQHPYLKKLITKTVTANKIDVCYVQLIRMCENVPKIPDVGYYLDYMDCFSAGMFKRAERANGLIRLLYLTEAKRLQKYEHQVANRFNAYSIISEADRDEFQPPLKNTIQIIPNGISHDFLDFESHPEKDIDLIFTGNMNYYPNVEAVRYLCKQIIPGLLKDFPQLKVYIVGTDPTPEVLHLASSHVVVTGYVPDLRPYLARAKVAIAPMFFGSGLQNKLLEAMAMGIPVLTSPLANSSLNAPEDEAICIADTPDGFIEKALNLLRNEHFAQHIGANGKQYVTRQFDWSKRNAELEEGLESTIHLQKAISLLP
jgi:sugar transferase (PEP-CTERM/EpsH1 system associated)